ncbi:hypothetical protein [Streptomyces sp. A012304]|uniref:hypothetical protein n=1 Tax=Streptomyces sp. A012304 TaxID=375446 RepID=UPI002232638B|nr:hypothetical protein [Streptomyces sp. A012304]GKQ41593.1 hypothetical protein ALMP_81070 [Streptomyces sp. A012304]
MNQASARARDEDEQGEAEDAEGGVPEALDREVGGAPVRLARHAVAGGGGP